MFISVKFDSEIRLKWAVYLYRIGSKIFGSAQQDWNWPSIPSLHSMSMVDLDCDCSLTVVQYSMPRSECEN